MAAINILTDLAVLLLPIKPALDLNVNRRKKSKSPYPPPSPLLSH